MVSLIIHLFVKCACCFKNFTLCTRLRVSIFLCAGSRSKTLSCKMEIKRVRINCTSVKKGLALSGGFMEWMQSREVRVYKEGWQLGTLIIDVLFYLHLQSLGAPNVSDKWCNILWTCVTWVHALNILLHQQTCSYVHPVFYFRLHLFSPVSFSA